MSEAERRHVLEVRERQVEEKKVSLLLSREEQKGSLLVGESYLWLSLPSLPAAAEGTGAAGGGSLGGDGQADGQGGAAVTSPGSH